MATLSATQPGNIGDPLTWGGITPTSVDILDSNGHIININNNSLYSKLKNTFGGYFLLSDGINLSADIENTQTAPVSALSVPSYCVLYEGVTFASITGKIKGGSLLDRYGLYINNNGQFIINGSPAGGYTLSSQGGGIAVKTSVFARNQLIINGNLGTEGTFANPLSSKEQFACVNSEALSSIIVNGNINIPNNASTISGIQGLVVKNTAGSPTNPNVTINGNITIYDYHNYGASIDNNISGIRYSCSTTALPGSININGDIIVGSDTWYYGILSTGKTNITVKGNIIGGFQGNVPLRISNNNSSTILLSCASEFTGNATGNSLAFSPVQIRACNNMTVNIIGNIKNQFLRVGVGDNSSESTTNSIINIEGNILNSGGAGAIRIEDYCTGLTMNIAGNIYGGTSTSHAIYIRALNRSLNTRLNVFATEIVGGTFANAITTDVYDQNIYFDINAIEIAANPSGGNGHAIQAPERYTGTFKINTKRIFDNFAGVTALFVRAYDLSEVPADAVIRYAAAPFLGIGPYVIHSTVNSLSTFQMPPPEFVREGVIYAGGSLIGACRIPSISSVLLGTPVGAPDGSMGISTLDESLLNYDAIYNAPLTAFNYSNSVGERLRRGPTTEIVGEIIESFYPVH